MKSYEDSKQMTSTCFKLECNHAYHTKCIIECLSKTAHKCPQCNKYKTPEQKLSEKGLAEKLLKELRRGEDVEYSIKEYKEASKEFKSTYTQLKKDIVEYAKARGDELQYSQKHKYMKECIASIKAEIRITARLAGPMYIGATRYGDRWERERYFTENILGEHNRRNFYRIRNIRTYFYIKV